MQCSDEVMRSSPGEQPAQPLPAALRVAYHPLEGSSPWPAGVLAAIRFGTRLGQEARELAAGLTIDVGLESLNGPREAASRAELWFATGPVHTGQWSDAGMAP